LHSDAVGGNAAGRFIDHDNVPSIELHLRIADDDRKRSISSSKSNKSADTGKMSAPSALHHLLAALVLFVQFARHGLARKLDGAPAMFQQQGRRSVPSICVVADMLSPTCSTSVCIR
jgi:hypothetical protein